MHLHHHLIATVAGKLSLASQLTRIAAVFISFLVSPALSRATVFDWPTSPAWPGTGPVSGATQTVDYGYYANGSIRVSVFNNGETWQAGYPIVQTGGARTTTGGTGVNGFQLFNNNVSNVVTNYDQVTINFMYSGGAQNISFQIWDVDSAANFTDKISNIVGTTLAGATVEATTITPTATFNQVNGTVGVAGVNVTGIKTAANDKADGTVTIGFSQIVSSISFQWSNDLAGGTTQAIGIGPVTFTGLGTVFPEVNSSNAALMVCGGVMGFGLVRRRRSSERLPCPSHA